MGITNGLRVDLQLNGVWTNVSAYVATQESVVIKRGRSSESGGAQPSSANLTLLNSDARFTPRNPAGAYYPYFNRNTPIRTGVGTPPQGAGTLNNAIGSNLIAPGVNAESAGIVFSLYAQTNSSATITGPAGYTMATQQSGASNVGLTSCAGLKAIGGSGVVVSSVSTSTVSAPSAAVTVFIPGATATSNVVAKVNYSATATANQWSASAAATAVVAGDVLVALVAWSEDRTGAMVCAPVDASQHVEWQLVGDSGLSTGAPRCQVWTRYCTATETLTVRAPGPVYGAADVQFTLYKVTGATAWNPRFSGLCSDIQPTGSALGRDLRTNIACGSVLRQRGQGEQAVGSAIYRYITPRKPVAYWPLESGTALSSPIPGVQNATTTGTVTFDSDNTFSASASLPLLAAGSTIRYPVPAYTPSGAGTATAQPGSAFFVMNLQGSPPATNTCFSVFLANGGTSASIGSFDIQNNSTSLSVIYFGGDNSNLGSGLLLNLPLATPQGNMGVWVRWFPNVANPTTKTDIYVALVDCATGNVQNSASVGLTGTAGQVMYLGTGIDANLNAAHTTGPGTPMSVGHMMFDNSSYSVTSTMAGTNIFPSIYCRNLATGWLNETPTIRMRRVCQDESIFHSVGSLSNEGEDNLATLMGAQPISTGLDLINLTANTDIGELSECRGFVGLMYRQRATMEAQAIAMALDYSAGQIADPFQPTDDDQNLRNDFTVTNTDQSTARATLTTGTLGSMTTGTYTGSANVNLAMSARDLQSEANAQLTIGTVDQSRFAAINVILGSNVSLINSWTSVDIGNRIRLNNTPAWIQPGPTDQIVIGCTEKLGAVNDWSITWTGRPYTPFNVLRLDAGAGFAELDTHYLGMNGGA